MRSGKRYTENHESSRIDTNLHELIQGENAVPILIS
jgi:hypothetical protein